MSENKWTEGEWWIEEESGDIVALDGNWEICTFTRDDATKENDFNLMAASKQLYEALEDTHLAMSSYIKGYNGSFAAKRNATALAKARGEYE